MVNRYPFYKRSPKDQYWRCSTSTSNKCRASLEVIDGAAKMINADHTHPFPTFKVGADGKYYRLTKNGRLVKPPPADKVLNVEFVHPGNGV